MDSEHEKRDSTTGRKPSWNIVIVQIGHVVLLFYHYFGFRDVKKQDCYGLRTHLPHFSALCRFGWSLWHTLRVFTGKYSREEAVRPR